MKSFINNLKKLRLSEEFDFAAAERNHYDKTEMDWYKNLLAAKSTFNTASEYQTFLRNAAPSLFKNVNSLDDMISILKKYTGIVEQDQDNDGDNDFADVMIARMIKSGMSREDAIKKVKDKKYNEAVVIDKNADPTAVKKAQELAKDTKQDLKIEADGASADEEDKFHTKLDKLVHKTFGKSSDEEEIDESSTSAATPGYMTPKAFSGQQKKMKYSGVAEAMDKKYEALIESYKKFALGDAKMTPDKKVKETIKEVSKRLQEIEQLVHYSSRLKTESGLSRDGYGPAVNNALTKISERLIKISERVRSLGE